MRYRLEHKSGWFNSLKFAIGHASKVKRGRGPVRLIDETGVVVWTSDELPKVDVTPVHEPVEPQGDLF